MIFLCYFKPVKQNYSSEEDSILVNQKKLGDKLSFPLIFFVVDCHIYVFLATRIRVQISDHTLSADQIIIVLEHIFKWIMMASCFHIFDIVVSPVLSSGY